ncbi:MBL fold metallo-hydrolase [Clostridium beijerinckii]|uniref:Glyoxylase-like metal-dependent hydrolase (Beta-lactamase superfamily II) n=1 Tax=Clostridium beijerinckii TaxID=1520 RepID=A0A0B5QBN4_CLOBE|nr:MBL fold metallo-hydrolase [Clostridium beijerinckii]AJG98360.1 MBL fold metallo-hydrolase [Clostridium beijerinckii]AQS04236.1 putative metallo-hydrolase [Clostridium beijerinckii]MBA2883871.1 glyoxylase-like metal-dependent hydrolase (beta-lactamase superfamily II) [Clostridium beijerinckii]MBA2899057.1 glyoxylase-like metal-dependent hydrolase (beta-lactamase superfamily II) [Clostridium beijerinckii]MBA2908457.1 glyoxylase-like metal-dependent hydrolase (beta-lactamase superfamily II) [
MIIKTLIAGMYEENCYLIMDEGTKELAIIDPGGQPNLIEKEISKLDGKPKFILLTHGHMDHVGAVIELMNKLNIPFYISENEEQYMKNDEFVFGSLPKASKYLKEGDTVSLGNNIIKVIETAGHTAGGICFLVNDELFTGDTLFQGSIGRSDFPGGNGAQLIKNIKEKLLPLGDSVKVYPGHGPASTIGYEKRNNPFL